MFEYRYCPSCGHSMKNVGAKKPVL
jgi:NADH pyrophosphatase NudC (nudix superfamily)